MLERRVGALEAASPASLERRLAIIESTNPAEIRYRQDQVLKIIDRITAALDANVTDHSEIKATLAEVRAELKAMRDHSKP
jgi:hypothetical protein